MFFIKLKVMQIITDALFQDDIHLKEHHLFNSVSAVLSGDAAWSCSCGISEVVHLKG